MTKVKDKNLLVVLSAIMFSIALLIGMLFWAPPLEAEDTTPQVAKDVNSMLDPQFEGMLGKWTGGITVLGKEMSCVIDVSMDLNGRWLKMEMIGYHDSTNRHIDYHAHVYIRPDSAMAHYRAYLVDNAGSGQVGKASVKQGVWSWVWEWDDGTREDGTMVTTLPNRITYESRINDKLGNPLPAIEFDLTKTGDGEQVQR
ncbi:MAG: hypothetical protein IPH75_05580 [bacterium]|nr:hypothetical protein [bacterium]